MARVGILKHYESIFKWALNYRARALILKSRALPGGPMVRVLGFHCRDSGFDPQSGNYDPTSSVTWPKNREGGREEGGKEMDDLPPSDQSS